MRGIVSLHLKNAALHPRLGDLLVPMLECMSSRGPDSAGMALHDGDTMEVVKDVGSPEEISARHAIVDRAGFQGAGRTRMATESAVATQRSHPFASRPDMAVVHNGSFSNHAPVRRRLERPGIAFTTDNDTEVAARFLGYQVAVGADLAEAMRAPGGTLEPADAMDSVAKPCYEVKGLTRMWDLSTLSRYMNTLGWGNYANDHEDGNGQFGNNFVCSDAVTTADRTIFFCYMVPMLAHEAGMTATFMPKPISTVTGNGQHLHGSLRTALGRVPGGDFIDYYADVKQAEFDAYHATVSEWEIDRHLTFM